MPNSLKTKSSVLSTVYSLLNCLVIVRNIIFFNSIKQPVLRLLVLSILVWYNDFSTIYSKLNFKKSKKQKKLFLLKSFSFVVKWQEAQREQVSVGKRSLRCNLKKPENIGIFCLNFYYFTFWIFDYQMICHMQRRELVSSVRRSKQILLSYVHNEKVWNFYIQKKKIFEISNSVLKNTILV